MASTYFGNTLTDLQSGITAGERNAGDTERAKVAADAAKMSAYFNLLSNKAKTESDAHAHEAENARQYFTLNMQDAQKKAELAQAASLAGQQWSNQFKLQEGALTSQKEIAAAQNEARLKEAGIQYAPGRITPQVALEQEKERNAKTETARSASALASMANSALDAAHAQFGANARAIWNSPTTTPEARRAGVDNARVALRKAASEIQLNLGRDASLIRFDPNTGRFEPSIGVESTVRMLPDMLPITTQTDTGPAPFGVTSSARTVPSSIQWINRNGKLIKVGSNPEPQRPVAFDVFHGP